MITLPRVTEKNELFRRDSVADVCFWQCYRCIPKLRMQHHHRAYMLEVNELDNQQSAETSINGSELGP